MSAKLQTNKPIAVKSSSSNLYAARNMELPDSVVYIGAAPFRDVRPLPPWNFRPD